MTENSEDNIFFGSDSFDIDILVKDEHNNKTVMATKQQKREIAEFIGGFERWTELATDCKMYIIGNLDYMSRSNLSLCSKLDNRIVKDTILFITTGKLPQNDGIRMRSRNLAGLFKSDFEQENSDGMIVKTLHLENNSIEMCTTSNFVRAWRFLQGGTGCQIIAKSSLENQFTYSNVLKKSNTSVEEEIMKLLKKIIKKFKVDTFHVALKFKNITRYETLGNVKNLELKYSADKKLWLSILNSDAAFDSFSIYTNLNYGFRISRSFPFQDIAHQSVINAKTLRSAEYFDISEEQLFSMKATRMAFGVEDLRVETILEFIRRWVNDEVDCDFRQLELWKNENDVESFKKIMEDFNAVQYDYGIDRYPNQHFFNKFRRMDLEGNVYEIRNRKDELKTLSVLVTERFLVILRTGFSDKKTESEERTRISPDGLICIHLGVSHVI